ncbi:glycoside hydrolase family 32 protein [Aneurinibacillus terranovensis]|uniref:glycoside hydrolase family 32 protein n=1 Tax=Aneurinibacillus terranovensis TaxID=278991 RepID=UPI000407450B|nr:sucrose-6-phosphate hydrolase [Aneurinibacillus terranovensis]
MEWTNEQRYRRIEDVAREELDALKMRVANCLWRQTFHIQPETGLLNDPNGFSYFNGEYHLFYQWFPLGPVHGLKYWYHMKSKDLVHWDNGRIGIEPKEYFESHGVYSGSALEYNGKLYLFYTGNTRDENWIRHPYQCMAVMDRQGKIAKFAEPVIRSVPAGYTDHFRDPKLWKQGDTFYAVIGAQRVNKTGCAVLYRSPDLTHWEFVGEIETGLQTFGFMWECPDYFELENNGILMFSPQGLQPEGDFYQNIYQSGYLMGEKINLETRCFIHGEFIELDRGFDFYAPQTMLDPNGRRLLVGWMGLPDIETPTSVNGWAHCLTLPRELSIKNNKLIQQPIPELQTLRTQKQEMEETLNNEIQAFNGFEGAVYELICEFHNKDADEFGIHLRVGEKEKTIIKFDWLNKKVVFDRSDSGEPVAAEYGTVRKCRLEAEKIKFHIFVDSSSVEIFVNDGEEVFTGRIFSKPESRKIQFFAIGGEARFKAMKWDY